MKTLINVSTHLIRGRRIEVHLHSDGTDYEALPMMAGAPLALRYPHVGTLVPVIRVTGRDRVDSLRTHGIDLADHAMASVRDEVARLI